MPHKTAIIMDSVKIHLQGSGEAMEQVRKKLRKYLFANFLFGGREDSLGNDTSFLEKGIIDSTGILEIVNYIEEEFGIKVEDEEMIPENLDSINRLTAYISHKGNG